MSNLMVAKSYANAERIKEYEKNGKMYATIKEKCDRCNGRGDYWWGAMINGRPQFSGTCYACGGQKYFIKEVRLYTEEEYARMESANERAHQRKAEALEAKMKAEFETKRAEWLAKNNFSPDGYTYIVTGDSFSIKDELKASGWKYDPVIKWHKADPAGYEDRTIKINVEDFFQGSAWGDYHYLTGAKDKMDNLLKSLEPQIETEWYGEVGGKIKDITVELVRKYAFDGRYGTTNVLTFKDNANHVFVWFTSTFPSFDVNEHLVISSATIKDHTEYNEIHQTVITRAKLKSIEDAEDDHFNWENEILNG